ncbi:GNAT family N-acetyltransferase [soil metagenome]
MADAALLSRIEDAGLNASAAWQQRWMDGWLVRFAPVKAKRARCINAVAAGCTSIAQKLELCQAIYAEADVPLVIRITPFSQPADLDAQLAGLGMARIDDTRVRVLESLASVPTAAPAAELPTGYRIESIGSAAFAQLVGALRGSPQAQRDAQAERLAQSPVPFQAFQVIGADGAAVACGQFAVEAELVGLYDVFTAPAERGRGLARALCQQMLVAAYARGAQLAYLQVEGDNHSARRIYHALGFADAYAYHYRTFEPDNA